MEEREEPSSHAEAMKQVLALHGMLQKLCELSPNLAFGIIDIKSILDIPIIPSVVTKFRIPGTAIVFTNANFCEFPRESEKPDGMAKDSEVVWYYPTLAQLPENPLLVFRKDCEDILQLYAERILRGSSTISLPNWNLTTNRITNLLCLHLGSIGDGELWLGLKLPKDERGMKIFECNTVLYPNADEKDKNGLERVSQKLHFKSVPGTQIYYSAELTRSENVLYKQDNMLFIRQTSRVTPSSMFEAVQILNFLQFFLHNTFLCLEDNYQEAKDFMDNEVRLREKDYTPITGNFLSFLSLCAENTGDVYINPKYDGKMCWLYCSKSCPVMYIEAIKSKGRIRYKIRGALSDFKLPEEFRYNKISLCCEEVEYTSFQTEIVAYDCYSGSVESYKKRIEIVKEVVAMLGTSGNLTTFTTHPGANKLDVTKGGLLGKEGSSLTSLLDHKMPKTDGVVVYAGQSRPVKLKMAENMTVDITFKLAPSLVDDMGDIVGEWQVPTGEEAKGLSAVLREWLKKLKDTKIPEHLLPSPEEISTVYEIRISDCSVVRKRKDREYGNPIGLIDNIVQVYDKDRIYSNILTWSGKDMTLATSLNRTFKRCAFLRYIPKGSMIIDMGSGFLGDLPIWKDMGYRVVAVEKDVDRHKESEKKVASYTKVTCINSAMENFDFFNPSYSQYRWCTFMRSINMVLPEDRAVMLQKIMKTNRNILVVCAISDKVKEVVEKVPFQCSSKITGESIVLRKSKHVLDVQYSVGSKQTSVQSTRKYSDYLWTWKQWKELAEKSGYSAKVYLEQKMLLETFGIDLNDYKGCLNLCKLDVAIVLTRGK